jgi:hypothetical protein
MPLPQLLWAGAMMVGAADTLQTSIAIMNNDAFIGYVCWLCVLVMFVVYCVVFITYLLFLFLFVHE